MGLKPNNPGCGCCGPPVGFECNYCQPGTGRDPLPVFIPQLENDFCDACPALPWGNFNLPATGGGTPSDPCAWFLEIAVAAACQPPNGPNPRVRISVQIVTDVGGQAHWRIGYTYLEGTAVGDWFGDFAWGWNYFLGDPQGAPPIDCSVRWENAAPTRVPPFPTPIQCRYPANPPAARTAIINP